MIEYETHFEHHYFLSLSFVKLNERNITMNQPVFQKSPIVPLLWLNDIFVFSKMKV